MAFLALALCADREWWRRLWPVGACGVRGVRRGGRECWVERQLSGVVELSDESTSRFRFQASVRGVEQGVRLQRSRKGAVEADVGK